MTTDPGAFEAVQIGVDFLLFDWGILFTATAVATMASKFDLFRPVVGFLYPSADEGTLRITTRLAEVGTWLAVPLAFSTQVNLKAIFGAGIGALFIAYLVREPIKTKLSGVVAAAKAAAHEHLVPGARIHLPDAGIRGVIESIDTQETHIRLDNGNLAHVPNQEIIGNTWTTVEADRE